MTNFREQEPSTNDCNQDYDPQGRGMRSAGERIRGQQKSPHPAASTAQSPQPKLWRAPAAARSSLPEDTPSISDTQHSGGTVSSDVEATGEEGVGQRERGAGDHARPSSGAEASGGGRKPPPSNTVVDAPPEDRVPLAGEAVRDSGGTAEGREGQMGETDEERVEGERVSQKDGNRRHVEGGERQAMTNLAAHNQNDGADRQPRGVGGEHQQLMAKAIPTEDENGTPTSDTTGRFAVEAAGRRIGGEVPRAGEDRWTRSSGGELYGDGAKPVGPTSTAEAWPRQHQDEEAAELDSREPKDWDGCDVRSVERQSGRDNGVVQVQRRATEAADGPDLGADLEFGSSGVWEHMEGEGVEITRLAVGGEGISRGKKRILIPCDRFLSALGVLLPQSVTARNHLSSARRRRHGVRTSVWSHQRLLFALYVLV